MMQIFFKSTPTLKETLKTNKSQASVILSKQPTRLNEKKKIKTILVCLSVIGALVYILFTHFQNITIQNQNHCVSMFVCCQYIFLLGFVTWHCNGQLKFAPVS